MLDWRDTPAERCRSQSRCAGISTDTGAQDHRFVDDLRHNFHTDRAYVHAANEVAFKGPHHTGDG